MNSFESTLPVQYQNNSLTPSHDVFQTKNNTDVMNNYENTTSNNEYNLENLDKEKNIVDIWKHNFILNKNKTVQELNLNLKSPKMSWSNETNSNNNNYSASDVEENNMREQKSSLSSNVETPEKETVTSPSHHARRPMNAFLIFCKKHRPIVRKKYPALENRGVTRILGEWWALLDTCDKESYTNLAKEYKDAFFTANPNFKWYKLPAPPLRTNISRPVCAQKEFVTSPTHETPHMTEFTPGKLADESQLGLLSSLLNANNFNNKSPEREIKMCSEYSYKNCIEEQNNNFTETLIKPNENLPSSPEIQCKNSTGPPKPIKKRYFENYSDNNKSVTHSIFNESSDISLNKDFNLDKNTYDQITSNMTNQDIVDKVVESKFPNVKSKNSENSNGASKETRTSDRSCKGRRYAQFMVHSKLLKNKRDKRLLDDFHFHEASTKFEKSLHMKPESPNDNNIEKQTPKLDLVNTIKRLAERTNYKLEDNESDTEFKMNDNMIEEHSDDLNIKSSNFNLESRIAELPSLSYDIYLQRKKESKKRKMFRSKSNQGHKVPKLEANVNSENKTLIGSKKRKNKSNITHLQVNIEPSYAKFTNESNDLSGLATLAEIAANTEKIN